MADPASTQTPKFVTWEFLGTYAGASLLVAVLTNTFRKLTGIVDPGRLSWPLSSSHTPEAGSSGT